jgi:predicted lipid-binding transport protein (Tim44 family)
VKSRSDDVKHFFLTLMVALCGVSFVAADAQAKRLGGGSTSGMQRQMPAKPTPTSPPAQQAAPTGAAGATAAAAGKRSWLGPIAGLAAGLGLAALMSHLGLGEEFANMIMLALLAVVAFVAVRWLLRRFGPAAPQMKREMQFAGAGTNSTPAAIDRPAPAFGGGAAMPAAAAAAASLPAGFDSAAFERIAKLIFIRMQAANDKADLEDLRQFSTPEMFAVFKLELQDRGSAPQQTDVVQLAAEVVDFAAEDARQIVSVRFHGLIREVKDEAAAPFDETWHLVKPADGSREWAIAGIAQNR